jgi:hypothetical protein
MGGLEGKIVKTGPDHIVVQTADKGEVTIRTKPGTKFLVARPVQFSELQVGSTITVVYTQSGEEVVAETVVSATAPATRSTPATAVPSTSSDADVRADNYVAGQVVRIVGTDQIVVQTIDGTEQVVYVNPNTTFTMNGRPVRVAELRAGTPISVQVTERDGRRIVSQGVGLTALEGQVVRTVGTDQVIVRRTDGREVPVYVYPQTRYRLTPQGGVFTDLRPGSNVTVYYDNFDRGFRARHIFRPDRPGPRR